MSWLERLPTGSWRGFVFRTDDHDATGGHRLVVQQYPKRDTPNIEPFGKDVKGWRINAYFIGDDYDLEANGFWEKLDTPGADWLTHPYLGDLWVQVHKFTRSERLTEGGYCRFSIEFLPGDDAPYEPTVDKVDVAISRVREAQTVIVESFELQEMPGNVFDDMIADVQSKLNVLRKTIAMATLPLSRADQVMTVINGVKNDLRTLLGLPQQYASALANFADVLAFLDDPDDALSVQTRARAVNRISSYITNPPAYDSTSTQTATLIANNAADDGLRNQLLITSAAGLALTTYYDADTRDSVLNDLLAAIDSQLNIASPDVFDALLNVRAATMDALLDQDLSSYTKREIINLLPSALLAQQFGIDEDELLAINQPAHPLFMSGVVRG